MDEKKFKEKLLKDLDNHTIEELLIINYNCDNYSNIILNEINTKNDDLSKELEYKKRKK